MSIRGFNVGGVTQKYDYNALDNIPANPSGGGLTPEAIDALLACFQNVVWANANGEAYCDTLEEALQGSLTTSYSITYGLSHVTLSNTQQTIYEGRTYTATVTADNDYVVSSVAVTMGGNTVTGAYSNGTITIANVTGNIVITATAVPLSSSYTITNTLTNCTTNNSATNVAENAAYTATITAASGYTLTGATVSVTMESSGTPVDITSTAYNAGVISIAAVTGNVAISVAAADTRTLIRNWDLTQSLTDTINSATITVNSNAVQSSSGLTFGAGGQAHIMSIGSSISNIYERDYEFDIASMVKSFGSSSHGRFITLGANNNVDSSHSVGFIWRSSGYWQIYLSEWSGDTTSNSYTALSGKTLRIHISSSGIVTAYVGDTLIATSTTAINNSAWLNMYIGDTSSPAYTTVITGIRVYSTT